MQIVWRTATVHSREAAFGPDMELAEAVIGGGVFVDIVKQCVDLGNSAGANCVCKELPDVDCVGVLAAGPTASSPESEI